jgi:hypothetical protein
MYPTRFAPLYRRFSDLLDHVHRRNLAAILKNLWDDGLLEEGRLREVRVLPPLEAVIFIFYWKGELWLLAGYWVRKGEPTADLTRAVERYVRMIRDAEKLD